MGERMRSLFRAVADSLLLRGDVGSIFSVSVRQFVGSGVSTVLDMASFQGLLWSGVGIMTAATLAFMVGIVANYTIGSVYVFKFIAGDTVWSAKRFIVFCLCSLLTLGLNLAVIWLLSVRMGLLPIASKAISVLVLFFLNQWLSRKVVFVIGK